MSATGATASQPAPLLRRTRVRLWRDIFGLIREFAAAHPIAATTLAAMNLVGSVRSALYLVAIRGLVDSLVQMGGGGSGAGAGNAAGHHPQFVWAGI
jgi:hypothetical protein